MLSVHDLLLSPTKYGKNLAALTDFITGWQPGTDLHSRQPLRKCDNFITEIEMTTPLTFSQRFASTYFVYKILFFSVGNKPS